MFAPSLLKWLYAVHQFFIMCKNMWKQCNVVQVCHGSDRSRTDERAVDVEFSSGYGHQDGGLVPRLFAISYLMHHIKMVGRYQDDFPNIRQRQCLGCHLSFVSVRSPDLCCNSLLGWAWTRSALLSSNQCERIYIAFFFDPILFLYLPPLVPFDFLVKILNSNDFFPGSFIICWLKVGETSRIYRVFFFHWYPP